MLFSRGVRLSLCLTCPLLLSGIALAQSEGRTSARRHVTVNARQAGVPASTARREWDARRDWLHFTSGILGDTAVADSMEALLASGLGPGTQDRFGRTALHAAAVLGQVELARFLLARGAEVEARDREGRTPLMVSASAGGLDLFSGLAPTSPWGFFWTEPLCRPEPSDARDRRVKPLRDWHDVVTAQRPMLRLLLEAGADVAAKDSAGRDAFDHAALGGPTGFARLLAGKAGAGDQSRCDLTVAQSPEVRGLRLGMALGEVATRFRPPSLPEEDSCGRLSLQLDWGTGLLRQAAPRPRELAGVQRISLGFLGGRLAYLLVTYEREEAPPEPAEFRSALSAWLRLPGRWRMAGDGAPGDQPYSIACDGFTAVAGYHVGPYVELIDEEALRTLLGRDADVRLRRLREEEEDKERRRRVFRP